MPQKPSEEAGQSINQSKSTIKGAVSAAKATGTAINTAKGAIQVATTAAESSNPAGWVMLAMKLKPFADKLKRIIRKAQLAVGALIAWLILHLGLKIVGLVAGATFGAITGIPLLFLGPPGWLAYAGWVGFWGYYGWTHPLQMLNITQHPLIAALNAYNSVKGFLSGIGNATAGSTTTAISTSTGALAGSGIGFVLGGPVGAVVGAMTGATVGYALGQFVIPAFSNAAIFAKGFFSGALGAGGAGVGGFLGAAGSFFTGMASTMWGGLVSAGGGIFGGLSSIGGALLGGLGSGASISTLASVSVFGGVGTIVIGGTIIGITAAASFFNPETDSTQLNAGDNEFFTIEKTADPQAISEPPATITFTIRLTSKEKRLTAIQVSDKINASGENISFSQDQNLAPSCTQISELDVNTSWECQFEFRAENIPGRDFNDSLLTNTVRVRATPEGASLLEDSAVAVVRIGDPPSNCPSGWPNTGVVTQGPEGAASHARLGLEAIDIGTSGEIGRPVFATIDGAVISTSGSGLDQIIDVEPNGCAGLFLVRYQHLSEVRVSQGDSISWGQIIGATGSGGTGPHTHYQFNRVGERGFGMQRPNIPADVPRDCSNDAGCIPEITSAP